MNIVRTSQGAFHTRLDKTLNKEIYIASGKAYKTCRPFVRDDVF